MVLTKNWPIVILRPDRKIGLSLGSGLQGEVIEAEHKFDIPNYSKGQCAKLGRGYKSIGLQSNSPQAKFNSVNS